MHAELLDSALKMACASNSGSASQSDFRRALSTAYYAAFHFIVCQCADLLANDPSGTDLGRAWSQIYRTVQHADIRTACNFAADDTYGFPEDIKTFAVLFPTLKRMRESADYEPRHGIIHEQYVLEKIGETEEAIRGFADADRKHRQAFAVMVAYGGRKRNG